MSACGFYRVYHPYWTWEDIGMWRDVSESEKRKFLPVAIQFTGNARLYGDAMLRVIDEMPIACEHNLTELAMNRQAWIGHAACFLAIDCPEYITREAWGALSQQQRDEANERAAYAIQEWGQRYAQAYRSIHPQMDFERLPGWIAGRSAA